MQTANELFHQLIENKQVRGIRRFNLRKICRSFAFPPCGLSFWLLDDLNWDALQSLNNALKHPKIQVLSGAYFPRAVFDAASMGLDRRLEFVFLGTQAQHHAPQRAFFEANFQSCAKTLGYIPPCTGLAGKDYADYLASVFMSCLIQFSDAPSCESICDFFLTLALLPLAPRGTETEKDAVLDAIIHTQDTLRAPLARIRSNSNLHEKVNDILDLFVQIGFLGQAVDTESSQ